MIRSKIKTLATDTVSYGVFQTLGRFLAFLLTPLYSNCLTTGDNGVVAYLFVIIAIIQLIYSFGIEAAFFRFFDKNDESRNKKVFSNAFFTTTTISLFFTLLIILFSSAIADWLLPNYNNAALIIQVAALIPFFDELMVAPNSHMRMQRQIKRFAIIRFSLVLCCVILNIYFLIFTSLGVLGVFMAQVIASIMGACILLPTTLKMLDLNIDRTLFSAMLKFGLPTLPAGLSSVALQTIDRPIMKLYLDDSQIGIYQINAKLAVPMMMAVTIFDFAWKPFFLNHHEDSDGKVLFSRIFTYFALICMIIFLVVSLFLENIVKIPLGGGKYFIHPDYWNALYIAPIIMVGYFFSGASNNFAAVFHIEKKTKYLPIAISVATIISIILNFILIPVIGFVGAALALVAGYFSSALLMKFLQRKTNYKIPYEWRRIAIIFITTAIIFVAGEYVKCVIDFNLAFYIKIILLFIFILLLKIFGFFTNSEIKIIKSFFQRNKPPV